MSAPPVSIISLIDFIPLVSSTKKRCTAVSPNSFALRISCALVLIMPSAPSADSHLIPARSFPIPSAKSICTNIYLFFAFALFISSATVIISAFRWNSTSVSDISALCHPAESVAAMTGVRSKASAIFCLYTNTANKKQKEIQSGCRTLYLCSLYKL